jgi:hypothetical protein
MDQDGSKKVLKKKLNPTHHLPDRSPKRSLGVQKSTEGKKNLLDEMIDLLYSEMRIEDFEATHHFITN